MNQVALRRRIVALIIATLMAVSGATITTGSFPTAAQADDDLANSGNVLNEAAQTTPIDQSN